MSKPGLTFGLNLTKKPGTSKPAPPRRKSMFGGDSDSEPENDKNDDASNVQEIGGKLQDLTTLGAPAPTAVSSSRMTKNKFKTGPPTEPPKMKAKTQASNMFGDLSSTLASRKNAEAAAELDANIYEYDAVYDSLKPKKEEKSADVDRKPKYMRSLMQAADVRKRDALIAEEKKIAREREAEGEEYAGTEKFVTGAYKRQQEENRRLEEAEKKREEDEAKRNQSGGMSAFYRKLLDKDEQRHAEAVKAADDASKEATKSGENTGKTEDENYKEEPTEADRVKEMNKKGASVAVNEEGQVVDKRQLLTGGLNVGAKKKEEVRREAARAPEKDTRDVGRGLGYRKQAMRERQTQMIAEQLEESAKRSREEEESKRLETERASKSRKTEGEISSAKERYLARKKAAEEAKQKGEAT